jgi:hypothetical protein
MKIIVVSVFLLLVFGCSDELAPKQSATVADGRLAITCSNGMEIVNSGKEPVTIVGPGTIRCENGSVVIEGDIKVE